VGAPSCPTPRRRQRRRGPGPRQRCRCAAAGISSGAVAGGCGFSIPATVPGDAVIALTQRMRAVIRQPGTGAPGPDRRGRRGAGGPGPPASPPRGAVGMQDRQPADRCGPQDAAGRAVASPQPRGRSSRVAGGVGPRTWGRLGPQQLVAEDDDGGHEAAGRRTVRSQAGPGEPARRRPRSKATAGGRPGMSPSAEWRATGHQKGAAKKAPQPEPQTVGFVHEFRQRMFTTPGVTCRPDGSMVTRTGGTHPQSATERSRLWPSPVAGAFAPASGRAATGATPSAAELPPVLVTIRRGHCLPNWWRNAALRRDDVNRARQSTQREAPRSKAAEHNLAHTAAACTPRHPQRHSPHPKLPPPHPRPVPIPVLDYLAVRTPAADRPGPGAPHAVTPLPMPH